MIFLLEGTSGSMNLDYLLYPILAIMFGPAILFLIIGVILQVKKIKKAALVFFILAVIYVIVSIGICGAV